MDKKVLEEHGITPTPVPTASPSPEPLKEGDIITGKDSDGNDVFEGEVAKADDFKGIYNDDEGSRMVMVPEGFSADDETLYVDENGNRIVTYFGAVDAQMSEILTHNDYENFHEGNTRTSIEKYLTYNGYSKKEIEYALRNYDLTPEEETKMVVDWAVFAGIASKDTIEAYVVQKGADPKYIDWDSFDDYDALKNFVQNLQSDIPNIPIEEVKKFAKELYGFTDKEVEKVDEYFNYSVYEENK